MAGNRQKKSGQGFQVPSHVQTTLNKEERLLQRNLVDLEKETRHQMRCIVQDQQVAKTKLRSLQSRLLASQKKFHALIHPAPVTKDEETVLLTPDYTETCYFQSMMSQLAREKQADVLDGRKISVTQASSGVGAQESPGKGSRANLKSSLSGERRRSSTLRKYKSVVFTQ